MTIAVSKPVEYSKVGSVLDDALDAIFDNVKTRRAHRTCPFCRHETTRDKCPNCGAPKGERP